MSQQRQAEMDEDRVLVEAARGGDKAAFSKLMSRYQHRVYAVAYGMLHSRDDAMDVVQEAFLKVHRHLDRFQGQSSFYTWLYRIVVNLSIDLRRKRARSRTDQLNDALAPDPDRAAELEVSPARPGAQPLENAEDRELGRQIQGALDGLTENHRAILVLREVEGLSYEEMATVLGISKGTVMSRLFHARQNMQKALRPVLGLKEGEGLGGRPQEGGGEDNGGAED
ncbi:MAG: sigma-70 family RNA polymerase sigma factor [Myxococcota bacterium]